MDSRGPGDWCRFLLTPVGAPLAQNTMGPHGAELQGIALTTMVRRRGSYREIAGEVAVWMERNGMSSEITEHEVEFDIALINGAAVHAGDSYETDVKRVLVGTYLGDTWQIHRQR
jgi:hypothetical protein